jgi:hypothetical protein
LFLDILVKITSHARFSFFGKGALNLSAAAGTGNGPTDPAGIFPEIDPVIRALDSGRANAELFDFLSARISAAFLKLPAIGSVLWHFEPPFPAATPCYQGPLLFGDQLQMRH